MDLRTRLKSRAGRVGVPAVLACLLAVGGASPSVRATSAASAPRSVKGTLGPTGSAAGESEAIRPVLAVQTAALATRAHTVLFGAWVKPRGSETHQQAVAGMEAKAGRRFSVDHVYHGWDGPLIGTYERWSSSRGHTLLIGWKAVHETADGKSNGSGAGYVRWADIAAGRYDADIVARAREIKRFRKTVYLSFHHEPENDKDKPGWRRAGTPADYRAAWSHVRSVFRRQHVKNVRFVLVLMGWTFRTGQAGQWYPGSGVIDVVGADAYNWFGTAHPGSRGWTTFESAFRAAHHFAAAKRKPLWVTETGVQEDRSRPSRKADWYRSIAAQVRAWRNLEAIVFYMGGRFGWYPDSSGRSLAAFTVLGHNALFR